MTLPTTPNEPIAIGKYQILDLAGEGAMGAVYRARDTVLNRLVAIKVMNATIARDQSLRDRFLREAQSAGSLQHPNVVTIYDFGELDGHLFIAMEYVEGKDLETLLAEPHGLTLQARLEIMIDVLAGLAYAHQHGIVHRDLKPANIRVTPEPRGKLMDFGVAHLESQKMTQTGVMIGTPNYMAPEYISGKPVTASSDIFSMGAVLYEVLTGQKPFLGDTLHALLFSVVQNDPAPPSEIKSGLPRALDAVVMKAMAKDPAARYESAIEMAQALTAVRASLSGAPYNDSLALSQTLAHKVAAKGADVAREAAAREAASAARNRTLPPPATAPASAPANKTGRLLVSGIAAVGVLAVAGFAFMRSSGGAAEAEADAVIAQADAPSTGANANATPNAASSATTGASDAAVSASNGAPTSGTSSNGAVASPVSEPPRSNTATASATQGRAPVTPPQTQARAGVNTTPSSSGSAPGSAGAAPSTNAPAVQPAPVQQAPSTPAVVEPTVTAPPTSAPVAAPVVEARSSQNELRDLIARYARAISSRDINSVRAAYPGISRDQQQGFERFFSSTKSLTASLILGGLEVHDRTADGRVTGTYEFIGGSGRKEVQMVSFRAQFERDGDNWRLTSVR
ncbi:MAG TPA: protein kinase [Gemmatimonas sp.]|uniref:serine/threonine-protein kinase n=1 Tax=Gemmatimonas sp. TaxID=1962908 RepID=UPI002EDB78E3